MFTVYGMADSGNCYKVKLTLEQLALPYRWVEVDSTKGERARVLQWMFFEQYSHEPYIAVVRFILRYLPPQAPRRAELPRLQERGNQALAVMEQHLRREPFFAGGRYSVADIALFAYTQSAGEYGFDLKQYPAIGTWLDRVRAQPRLVPLG